MVFQVVNWSETIKTSQKIIFFGFPSAAMKLRICLTSEDSEDSNGIKVSLSLSIEISTGIPLHVLIQIAINSPV